MTADAWFDDVCRSYSDPPVFTAQGTRLPAFPPDDVQIRTTSLAGVETLREAFAFYRACIDQFAAGGNPVTSSSRVLDFGTGWGRIARFFLERVPLDSLYGIDVMPEFIEICRETFDSTNFIVVDAFPPTRLPAHSFTHIVGYPVFSHLSEEACQTWAAEFRRILVPRGSVALTTRGRWFLDYCASLQKSPDGYGQALSTLFDDFEAARARYDAGEFVHASSPGVSGGGVLSAGYYGETFIPEQYARTGFLPHLQLEAFLTDDSAQPHPTTCLRAA